MAINASDSGGGKDFKKVPPGCHFAICNMVVDLGIQRTEFKGQAKSQHKVYIRWEVPDERITYEKDGKTIEGPSVRFAEMVANAWGNIRWGGRVIEANDRYVVAQGFAQTAQCIAHRGLGE